MKRFEMRMDPLTQEVYYEVYCKSYQLMSDPLLNKGYAFSKEERRELYLSGLMPDTVGTLEDQIARNYGHFKGKTTDLDKYVMMMALLDRSETIFYAVLTRYLEEMLPIVYTPTVGQACLQMSHILRRWRGLYVNPNNVNYIEGCLQNIGLPNISLLVATDGERILGLGDLGSDGMGIPIGKIALYVAAAGIHPASTLPVCIDVGTNTERLLKDPLYLGYRHERLTGDAYYAVIERFVQGVRRVFPRALLQWEDFGKQHAFNLLESYKDRLLSFNDDIQGTGATAASALRTAMKVKGTRLSDERIAILGFGQAGSGVANAIVTMMCADEGISEEEARRRIWAVDIDGLLLEGMTVEPYQANFLQPREALEGWDVPKTRAPQLAEVVRHAKITALIGLSAQPGAFDREMLAALAANSDRPIVLALSNPTSRSECTPDEVNAATGGRFLMCTGSPFPSVMSPTGREMIISQCNNLYIFPGMGLGAIMSQATRITHRMFHAASCAVSDMVTAEMRSHGLLLPPLCDIRRVSLETAFAVAQQAREDGLGINVPDERLREVIQNAMWEPQYYPYRFARTP
ncbi:MAG: NAD-dependent malic enzyme [Candidatus Zixiibacteriota bacterium]|nr:MAG: NAD-dependent malic enzyme [candidate division Zixibacteria bacterium]